MKYGESEWRPISPGVKPIFCSIQGCGHYAAYIRLESYVGIGELVDKLCLEHYRETGDKMDKTEKVKGGTVLLQTLGNGAVNVYEVQSVDLGGVGELSTMALISLGDQPRLTDVVVDGLILVHVPANLIYAAIEKGIFEVYNKAEG